VVFLLVAFASACETTLGPAGTPIFKVSSTTTVDQFTSTREGESVTHRPRVGEAILVIKLTRVQFLVNGVGSRQEEKWDEGTVFVTDDDDKQYRLLAARGWESMKPDGSGGVDVTRELELAFAVPVAATIVELSCFGWPTVRL
jgi:hypothetical protein